MGRQDHLNAWVCREGIAQTARSKCADAVAHSMYRLCMQGLVENLGHCSASSPDHTLCASMCGGTPECVAQAQT